MSDLNISIGYLGDDIIALCRDYDEEYAFYGQLHQKSGEYYTRIQGTDGLMTTGRFKKTIADRQMVMIALAKHFEVMTEHKEMQVKERASQAKPALH